MRAARLEADETSIFEAIAVSSNSFSDRGSNAVADSASGASTPTSQRSGTPPALVSVIDGSSELKTTTGQLNELRVNDSPQLHSLNNRRSRPDFGMVRSVMDQRRVHFVWRRNEI